MEERASYNENEAQNNVNLRHCPDDALYTNSNDKERINFHQPQQAQHVDAVSRKTFRHFNLDSQDDPFKNISLSRPMSYNLDLSTTSTNMQQQLEDEGCNTLPFRRRKEKLITHQDSQSDTLADNIFESFTEAQNNGVINMSAVHDRVNRRRRRQTSNRDSKADVANFWDTFQTNPGSFDRNDDILETSNNDDAGERFERSVDIPKTCGGVSCEIPVKTLEETNNNKKEENVFLKNNDFGDTAKMGNEIYIKTTEVGADMNGLDEQQNVTITSSQYLSPEVSPRRRSITVNSKEYLFGEEVVNSKLVEDNNFLTSPSSPSTRRLSYASVVKDNAPASPTSSLSPTGPTSPISPSGPSSPSNPATRRLSYASVVKGESSSPSYYQPVHDDDLVFNFDAQPTTTTVETDSIKTTAAKRAGDDDGDVAGVDDSRQRQDGGDEVDGDGEHVSVSSFVKRRHKDDSNRHSKVDMEQFWNSVALRKSQDAEQLLRVAAEGDFEHGEDSDGDREEDLQSNDQEKPRVQKRSPAIRRRNKRNTVYRNSQAAMENFWNDILIHGNASDSDAEDVNGETIQDNEDDTANKNIDDEEDTENIERRGSKENIIEESPIIKLRQRRQKGKVDYRNSRADLEDFWKEITTNEENDFDQEKSFEIEGISVKEKQLEIQTEIEEHNKPIVKEPFDATYDDTIVKLRNKDTKSNRNSRVDLEDFWQDVTTNEENDEHFDQEKSFEIEGVDVKEKQLEIQTAMEEHLKSPVKEDNLDIPSIIRRNKDHDSNRNSRADLDDFWQDVTTNEENDENIDQEKSFEIEGVDVKEKQLEIQTAIDQSVSPIVKEPLDASLLDIPVVRRKQKDYDSDRSSPAESGDFSTEFTNNKENEQNNSQETNSHDTDRNSRADLEDYWQEITTSEENDEYIDQEKSFELEGVDVKEKQLEIQTAMEENLKSPVKEDNLDIPSIIRRNKDHDSNRNSRADLDDFWQEITTSEENDENIDQEKSFEIEGVDVKEKQMEIQTAIDQSVSPIVKEPLDATLLDIPVVRRKQKDYDSDRSSKADLDDFWMDDAQNIDRDNSFEIEVVEDKHRHIETNKEARTDVENVWNKMETHEDVNLSKSVDEEEETSFEVEENDTTVVEIYDLDESDIQDDVSSNEETNDTNLDVPVIRRKNKDLDSNRNSRADIDDFWNEITTDEDDENTQSISEIPSIDISMHDGSVNNVSQKTIEENDIDGDDHLKARRKSERNSFRDSRADIEDFWNVFTADDQVSLEEHHQYTDNFQDDKDGDESNEDEDESNEDERTSNKEANDSNEWDIDYDKVVEDTQSLDHPSKEESITQQAESIEGEENVIENDEARHFITSDLSHDNESRTELANSGDQVIDANECFNSDDDEIQVPKQVSKQEDDYVNIVPRTPEEEEADITISDNDQIDSSMREGDSNKVLFIDSIEEEEEEADNTITYNDQINSNMQEDDNNKVLFIDSIEEEEEADNTITDNDQIDSSMQDDDSDKVLFIDSIEEEEEADNTITYNDQTNCRMQEDDSSKDTTVLFTAGIEEERKNHDLNNDSDAGHNESVDDFWNEFETTVIENKLHDNGDDISKNELSTDETPSSESVDDNDHLLLRKKKIPKDDSVEDEIDWNQFQEQNAQEDDSSEPLCREGEKMESTWSLSDEATCVVSKPLRRKSVKEDIEKEEEQIDWNQFEETKNVEEENSEVCEDSGSFKSDSETVTETTDVVASSLRRKSVKGDIKEEVEAIDWNQFEAEDTPVDESMSRNSVIIDDIVEEEIDWGQFETAGDLTEVAQVKIIQSECNSEIEDNQSVEGVAGIIQSEEDDQSERIPEPCDHNSNQSERIPEPCDHDGNQSERHTDQSEQEDNQSEEEDAIEEFYDPFAQTSASEIVKINSVDGNNGMIITKSVVRRRSEKDRFSFEYSDDDCYETNVKSPLTTGKDGDSSSGSQFEYGQFVDDTINSRLVTDSAFRNQRAVHTDDVFAAAEKIGIPQSSSRLSNLSAVSSELYESDGDLAAETTLLSNEDLMSTKLKRKTSIHKLFRRNSNRSVIKNEKHHDQSSAGGDDLTSLLDGKGSVFQTKKKRKIFPFMKKKKAVPPPPQPPPPQQNIQKDIENEVSNKATTQNLHNEIQKNDSETKFVSQQTLQKEDSLNEVVVQDLQSEDDNDKKDSVPSIEITKADTCTTEINNNHQVVKDKDDVAKQIFLKLGKTIDSVGTVDQLLKVGMILLKKFGLCLSKDDLWGLLCSEDDNTIMSGMTKKSQFLCKAILSLLRKKQFALQQLLLLEHQAQQEQQTVIKDENREHPPEKKDVSRDEEFDVDRDRCLTAAKDSAKHAKKMQLMKALLERAGKDEDDLQTLDDLRFVRKKESEQQDEQLDDCALQLSHSSNYLDLELSIDEQYDLLEGFKDSRKNTIILRTQLSVRVHNIITKLLTASGKNLRRALFSLKQIFQDDKDLVHEFVTNDGLSCLITVGTDADQNYQNYILRAIGQIMLYVDGMNGVIDHHETIQWLYSLLSSKYRLVQKTSLKLLLVFVEYTEMNAYLVWQAAVAIDNNRAVLCMKGIADILTVDPDGTADEDLLVYAMTLVNKILYALPEQNQFYDVADSLEEQNMESIIEVLMKRTPRNSDLIEQCNIYELSIKSEDGEELDASGLKNAGIRTQRRSNELAVGVEGRRKSRRASSIKPGGASPMLGKSKLAQEDVSETSDTDTGRRRPMRANRSGRRDRGGNSLEEEDPQKVRTKLGHIDKEMPSKPVHLLQNGHATHGRRVESSEVVQPEEPPKSPGGRLRMKETFDVAEDAKPSANGRVPLRERLAQRQKDKTGSDGGSESSTPTSSTTTLPKVTAEDADHTERKPSESGGENRRMRLRMMYGSSVDKTDQEMADDIKKMNLGQSIADRKAQSEKTKIEEKPDEPTTASNDIAALSGTVQQQQSKVKKEKEEKEKEKKEEKQGFMSKVKSAIGAGSKPSEPPAPPKNENKNQRSAEDLELEARVLRSRPLVINEYDFKDLTEDDDFETLLPPAKGPPPRTGMSMVDGVPPPPPPPPGFGPPPPPPGFGPPPPPGMPPPPPPPPGMPPPPPPPPGMAPKGGGSLKTTTNRKFVRLFWQEVKQIGLPQPLEKTIWGDVKAIEVDTKKIEHLFENRVKQSLKRAESVDKLAKKEIAVLDLKRAQAINIVLTKLPPVRVIKQAILDMDAAVVDREGIEKIMSMVPTDEERTKLQEAQMQNPDVPFAHAESFLISLSSVSELSARLNLWMFKVDYDNLEKEIGEALSDLKLVCSEIRKSDTFRKILGLLLSIGNFLNGVNIKGFSIQYLEKVPEVKDTVHKQSLLFHICNIMMEKFPDSTDLYSEFGAVCRASRCDYTNINGMLKKLDDMCKKSWEYLRLIAKHDSSSPLKQKLTDFLTDAGERIAILRVVSRRVTNRYTKLLLYLGMRLKPAQDSKPHEFCKTISEFALEYRTVRQRALETKKRKENMKKRTKTRGKLITESENFSGATTAVPVSNHKLKNEEDSTMDALQKAITGDTALSPSKSRTRKKAPGSLNSDSSKLAAPSPGGGNVSNYDTDDQTDQMMDMLVKTATSTEKRTRIRKNRNKDSKSTRKSARRTRTLKNGLTQEEFEALQANLT